MKKLNDNAIERQDFVDNAIFDLIKKLNPTKKNIKWDIEMIGDVRDEISEWIVSRLKLCSEQKFYPFINE